MKDWYYTAIIVILAIATIGFAWLAFKAPKCAYEYQDGDQHMCAVPLVH